MCVWGGGGGGMFTMACEVVVWVELRELYHNYTWEYATNQTVQNSLY